MWQMVEIQRRWKSRRATNVCQYYLLTIWIQRSLHKHENTSVQKCNKQQTHDKQQTKTFSAKTFERFRSYIILMETIEPTWCVNNFPPEIIVHRQLVDLYCEIVEIFQYGHDCVAVNRCGQPNRHCKGSIWYSVS